MSFNGVIMKFSWLQKEKGGGSYNVKRYPLPSYSYHVVDISR